MSEVFFVKVEVETWNATRQNKGFKEMMRKIVFICANLMWFSPLLAANQAINGIAAEVNNAVITQADLNQHINQVKAQLKNSHAPLPTDAVLCDQILQGLIDNKLQLQEAERGGLNLNSAELNHLISQIAERNHLTVAAMYQLITKQGMTVEDYKKGLLLQQLQNAAVGSRINVNDEEVDDFLRNFAPVNNAETAYHLRDILIALPDSPTPAQVAKAQARAQKIAAALRQGTDFQKLAQGEQGLEGGDLGWRRLAELPSPFVEPVQTLQDGEVAGPIRTPNGFHLIQLLGTQSKSGLSGNAKQRREQAQEMIYQRKLQQALISWIAQLRAQAYIKKFPVCPVAPTKKM